MIGPINSPPSHYKEEMEPRRLGSESGSDERKRTLSEAFLAAAAAAATAPSSGAEEQGHDHTEHKRSRSAAENGSFGLKSADETKDDHGIYDPINSIAPAPLPIAAAHQGFENRHIGAFSQAQEEQKAQQATDDPANVDQLNQRAEFHDAATRALLGLPAQQALVAQAVSGNVQQQGNVPSANPNSSLLANSAISSSANNTQLIAAQGLQLQQPLQQQLQPQQQQQQQQQSLLMGSSNPAGSLALAQQGPPMNPQPLPLQFPQQNVQQQQQQQLHQEQQQTANLLNMMNASQQILGGSTPFLSGGSPSAAPNPFSLPQLEEFNQFGSIGATGAMPMMLQPNGAIMPTPLPSLPGGAPNLSSLAQTQALPMIAAAAASSMLASQSRAQNLPTILAQPEDALKLSNHQVLLRMQIEVFQAAEEDISTHIRGRNKAITLGQVGIRCRHCSHLPLSRRQKGSVYFPATLIGIYQASQNMSTTHLQCGLCTEMPEEVKQQFVLALASKVASSGAGRPYWAQSARKLGLLDTVEHGIRHIHNLPDGVQLKPTS